MGVKNSGPGRKSFLRRWHLCACSWMREREPGKSGRESLHLPDSVSVQRIISTSQVAVWFLNT